jgi:SNF2 family DNA or RNA helicase
MPADLKLRHCQEMMRDWILDHNRCNIWASPGTGKTGATLTAFDILKVLGSKFFPVLVIAPKKVAQHVWPREQAKWQQFSDLRVVTLAGHETAAQRLEHLRRRADIYVVNYDLIQWLVTYLDEKKIEWPFKAVIADESTKLKNFRLRNGGKRATALARIQKHVGRWVNLTGTPSPNGLLDLWGQCWFLDRGERLGRTYGEFKKRYFDEDPYSQAITPRPGASEQIAAKIADITLSIEAKDYFDLPPLIVNHIAVDMSDEAMAMYRQMERDMFLQFGNKIAEAPNAAVMTMKCLQMASGAVYTEEGKYEEFDDSKLDALESIVAEAGAAVLVAYQWKFDVARIKRRFPGAVDIRTPDQIDAWNDGRIQLGLIHPASAGHGIDLAKGGNILVFYSLFWSLENYLQVIERLGPTRQAQHGLDRPVFLHHLVAQNTMDEDVVARLTSKRTVQDMLISRMKRITL